MKIPRNVNNLFLKKLSAQKQKLKQKKIIVLASFEAKKKQGFLNLQAKKPTSGNPLLNQRIQAEKHLLPIKKLSKPRKKKRCLNKR